MPVILTPFLGVLPHSLAQPAFPPCLFSPAQSWKSPCCSPLPQPLPLGQPMPTYPRWYLPLACDPSTVPSSVPLRMPKLHVFVMCAKGWTVIQKAAQVNWTSQELQRPGSHQMQSPYICFVSVALSHLFCSPIGFLGGEKFRGPLWTPPTSVCISICYCYRHTTHFWEKLPFTFSKISLEVTKNSKI